MKGIYHYRLFFQIKFPYVYSGVKEEIVVKLSEIECIKKYLRIYLSQFRRQDFVMVACHIYHKIK